MILLLLGWNLTLAGIVLIALSLMENVKAVPICGSMFLVTGLVPTILLRKTCAIFKSDPVEKTRVEKL